MRVCVCFVRERWMKCYSLVAFDVCLHFRSLNVVAFFRWKMKNREQLSHINAICLRKMIAVSQRIISKMQFQIYANDCFLWNRSDNIKFIFICNHLISVLVLKLEVLVKQPERKRIEWIYGRVIFDLILLWLKSIK